MTREEAIQWLKSEKWENANNKYKKEWNEAFDRAIEALSADIEIPSDKIVVHIETYRRLYEKYVELKHASADVAQGWITIKDGLPKLHKDVMATVWFENDGYDDDAFEIAFGFLDKFGKWHLRLADGCECIKGFYVQAWQPLPKPYRERREE